MKTSVHLPHYRTLFGLLLFTLMQPLQAASLGLTSSFPDFFLDTQTFTYDANCNGIFNGDCSAGQGKMTVTGLVTSYTEVGPGGSLENEQVTNDAFSLTAILDIAGETVVSGSFTLDGVVRGNPFPNVLYDGATSGGLLNGDLNLFGFTGNAGPSTGGKLEFTFNNASGYIAESIYPLIELGAVDFLGGGMILTVTNSTLASGGFGTTALSSDWTGTGGGDVFVPVPAAGWLLGSGLMALFGLGRVSKKQ